MIIKFKRFQATIVELLIIQRLHNQLWEECDLPVDKILNRFVRVNSLT